MNANASCVNLQDLYNELSGVILNNIQDKGAAMLDEYKYSITGTDCHDIRNLLKLTFISAKSGTDIDKLKEDIYFNSTDLSVDENDILVTNLRHYEALLNAGNALDKVKDGLLSGLSTEFVAQDLKDVLYHLGSITGEISSSDVLNNIFGRFCIGK